MPAEKIARRLGIARAATADVPLSRGSRLYSLVMFRVGIGLFLVLAASQLWAAPRTATWTYTPTGAANSIIYSTPAIARDGTIYVSVFLNLTAGGPTTRLYALNPGAANPNRVKWSLPIGSTNFYASPAIGVGGIIYISGSDTNVWAINPDRSPRWEFKTGGFVSSSAAIGADGTVYVGSYDNKVYAIDGDTGTQKWVFPTGGLVASSPAIGSDGTVYVGSMDGRLYALDGTVGTNKWAYSTGGGIQSSPAIGTNGFIYVGSWDHHVYALDSATRGPKWVFTTGDRVYSSPAIGIDGTVYVGSNDKNLYAIDGGNGGTNWFFATGGQVSSSPALGADGTIYVGSYDRNLYAVSPSGGTNANVATLDLVNSSPAIAPDGTVYFGSGDGTFYAVEGFAPGGLAPSPWPKFRLNAKNSGGLATLGIHRITNQVDVVTLAGSGVAGLRDGPGANAQFSAPNGSFIDPRDSSSVYVADAVNQCIRRIRSDGMVQTIAGSTAGVKGHLDRPGTSALFDGPIGLCMDTNGNVYVAETNNYLRKIDAAGNVTTLAGLGVAGYKNGNASVALFNSPTDVALGADGALYVTDSNNHRIRRVSLDGGGVIDWVGNGTASWKDGVGSSAYLDQPSGIAADRQGTLWFTEWHGQRVRSVDAGRNVTTLVGSVDGVDPEWAYVDGTGLFSRFHNPDGIVVDTAGNIFIAENQNFTVRRITPAGVVETVAGTGISGFQDGDGATAKFSDLTGITTDNKGNLYVTEGGNNRVRKITIHAPPSIVTQPTDATVIAGRDTNFTVVATGYEYGSAQFKYQWYQGGNLLVGKTAVTLQITNVQLANEGVSDFPIRSFHQ